MTATHAGAHPAQAPASEPELTALLGVLTLAQKVRLLTGADFWSLHAEPAIGLRKIVMSDGPAGVRGSLFDERDPSANIPSPTALAATWDTERVERLGGLLAAEARRKGVDVLLAPTVNLHRTPYGGRHFECLSEDPLLTAAMGAAFVRGVQDGGVAATVKHFVANDSETQRLTVDAQVEEVTLRELYLEPFRVIVREAGAWAVMAAYNSVNGTTMTENAMLAGILRGEWGFDGVTMSDWYAARTLRSAAAGLDLVMPGPGGPWGDALTAAVEAGEVPESEVDAKVVRLLRLAARVGALEGFAARPGREFTPAHTAHELRSAAAAGFVLLRNDGGLLPADPAELRTVALIGPNAAEARTLGGGSATVFPPYTVSPAQGIAAALGSGAAVTSVPGVHATDRVPLAPLDLLRLPDTDSPGIEVRFVAADGTVLGSEHRTVSTLNWLSRFAPDIPIGRCATVEVRTRLVAGEAGEYRVGASGIGRYRVTVRGEVAFEGDVPLPEGSDPVEALARPPQRVVPVTLAAGESAPVEISYTLVRPAHWLDEDGSVSFQLSAARPYAGDDAEIERAVALAAESDLAIVVVGTTEEVESEGFDRTSLALPGRQDELVRRVAAANPRTIAVVNSGAPVLLPWAGEVPAILATWFPGQEFGNALADVLFGATEPGGRLPVSWPGSEAGLPSTQPREGALPYTEGLSVGYRSGRPVLYPFGHGLGYTSWEYTEAEAVVESSGGVTVTVELRNAGPRRGREIVQVYASGPGSVLDRPVRWLGGFVAVDVSAGDAVTATIPLPPRVFQRWDASAGAFAVTPGPYLLEIGSSSQDRLLTVPVEVPGELSGGVA
jgi:beta-glucosidase